MNSIVGSDYTSAEIDMSIGCISNEQNNWHQNNIKTADIHSLAPYTGSFPADIAKYFITEYTDSGDIVLDPFSGSGTTALSAIINNRDALASDAFVYSRILTYAKTHPVSRGAIADYTDQILKRANQLTLSEYPDITNEDLHVFYSGETLDTLARMRYLQSQKRNSDTKVFFDALMCAILHGPSSHHLSIRTKDMFPMGTNYVAEYADKHNLEPPTPDIKDCILGKYDNILTNGPPAIPGEATVRTSQSQNLPFESQSADFALTSPPYMHLVKYTYDNWIRLWWLGADRNEQRNKVTTTQAVEKYETFINQSLEEIYRVLKPSGRVVVVAGDVTKHLSDGKKRIRTASIVLKQALDLGFEPETLLIDDYGVEKNTGYNVFNQIRYSIPADEAAGDTTDRCLVLRRPEQ